MSARPMQAAGVISLLMAGGHYVMGANELAPRIKKVRQVEASTALKGWYQGCFMYAVFGLNYLRLATVPSALYTTLDKAILTAQMAMHLFTLLGLQQTPPRVLSALVFALAGLGASGKIQG
ncbi:hypothetical protein RQP46_009984 [Phenoliferia psychrophenolica]